MIHASKFGDEPTDASPETECDEHEGEDVEVALSDEEEGQEGEQQAEEGKVHGPDQPGIRHHRLRLRRQHRVYHRFHHRHHLRLPTAGLAF